MNNIDLQNQKVKREYLIWRREAKGDSESTVDKRERAINRYEDFSKHADFKSYNKVKAREFKEYLREGAKISDNTLRTILLHVRDFFSWLCMRPGYRRIIPSDIDYLKVSKKESRIAAQGPLKEFPDIQYVLKLTSSIVIENEIDLRDRAMISFLFLTGMRDQALITLPLGCVDEDRLRVYQLPSRGVMTKFSKNIVSKIFPFDEKLVQYICEWIEKLRTKGFEDSGPFFPKSLKSKGKDSLAYVKPSEVVPEFWSSTNGLRRIFKERAEKASMKYFNPHAFRHAAVNYAFKHSKNNLELKAISQSIGHEFVMTTISNYGNFTPSELFTCLEGIDFSSEPEMSNTEMLKKLRALFKES